MKCGMYADIEAIVDGDDDFDASDDECFDFSRLSNAREV
jgi:hypothetical protein